MLDPDDRDYYERRAEAELALAERTAHPGACRSHYLLATYYLERLSGASADAASAVLVRS